jgi:DUF4097 and DUF4098 domain-containing protein YvlB
MEKEKSRTGVVVGVILLLVTCAVLAAAVSVVGWFALRSSRAPLSEWGATERSDEVRIERRFDVGAVPELEVDNVAGSVTVRDGREGQIYVVATKRSGSRGDLARIDVQVSQAGDKVIVKTRHLSGLRSGSVQIQISVPPDTLTDLQTNAGEITVDGLRAAVKAHTAAGSVTLTDVVADVSASSNAGSIEATDVSGEVRLTTNAGSIKYEGDPQGDCEFRTNAGSIELRLPEDLDMELDLSSNVGSVKVDYELGGRVSVSRRQVKGIVGSGADGKITAHTSAGGIELVRR